MIIKKLHIGIFAAAMLFAASCSNDDLESPGNEAQPGEEVTVSFSLALDDQVQTRAISDGSNINTVYYAIFDSNNNNVAAVSNYKTNYLATFAVDFSNSGSSTLSTSIDVDLVNGQSYTAVFWAQDTLNWKCYSPKVSDGDIVVTAYYNAYYNNYGVTRYGTATNNAEASDAFYGVSETFTVSGSGEIGVTMKRPFAQINVGVTTEDWSTATTNGITIAQSSVTIQNVATSLSLRTGKATGTTSATFSAAAIPSEELEVDTNSDGTADATYKWLSMTYVLLGSDQTTLDALNYTFTYPTDESSDSGTSTTDITLNLENVSVGTNYRTNILGSFLSSSATGTTTGDTTGDATD